MTADDLEKLFDAFATRAHWIDPLERWFHLADQVKRRERDRLTGAALRALDLYNAARVIRGWHAQLVGEPLPDVDELFGIHPKEAKRRMYGTVELRGNREVLPALLEHFGLYPWRVQLIVEGESDLAMLEEVLAARYDLTFGYLGTACSSTLLPPMTRRFELSKPEFARRLAHHAIVNPERDGAQRPVLELAEHLVRLTIADRRLRGELR